MNKTCNIGGLEISAYESMESAVNSVLQNGNITQGFAIAVNAEKVVSSHENPDVKALLKSASILYPDGAAVSLLMSKRGCFSVRIPGCELWLELMKSASNHKTPVYIIGAKSNVHNEVVKKLTEDIGVNVVGSCDGYFKDENILIRNVQESGAKIISVALGSPRQESFIKKCMGTHPEAFYMGVGGTYDVFTNRVKRAPEWFQRNNLEWLYRLLSQPTRIKRQVKLLKYIFLAVVRKI